MLVSFLGELPNLFPESAALLGDSRSSHQGGGRQAMLYTNCCTCDQVDRGEERIGGSRVGAKLSYEPAIGVESDAIMQAGQEGIPMQPMEPHTPQKVQQLVKEFAKCAVRGIPCELIDGKTGDKYPATYFIDQFLQRLTLAPDAVGGPQCVAAIAQIRDMHDYGANFPEVVRSSLSGEIKDRVLMIVFSDDTPPAFVVEASSVDRDRFMMCVKILRLYARTSRAI